jgi:hypothetical protein
MVWYRWQMFNGKWPGFRAFMDVDAAVSPSAGNEARQQPGTSVLKGDHSDRKMKVVGLPQELLEKDDLDGVVHISRQEQNPVRDSDAPLAPQQEDMEHRMGGAKPNQQGLPAMQPLMISKLNTVLVLLVIAGCMTQQWQGWPEAEVLDMLEAGAAGTTAVSGLMYARMYAAGKLLPPMSGQSREH